MIWSGYGIGKFLLALLIVASSFWFIEAHMKPTLLAVAEIRGRTLAVQSINEVIRENVLVTPEAKSLLDVKMDNQGRVAFIQPNTQAFNKISAEIAVCVQDRLKQMSEETIDIPIGQMFGSPFLASLGPPITVRILPAGTVQVNVVNKFESAGINQTKHLVYLVVSTEVKIVVPLVSKSFQVETQVPVAEYVVVGEVPGTYLQVPFKE